MMRIVGLLAFVVLGAMQSNIAGAATQSGNYSGGTTYEYASTDLLNSSSATSDAGFNQASGEVSATAAADSESPAGTSYNAIGLGGSEAGGRADITHEFTVTSTTATTLSVSASINVTSLGTPTATFTPGLLGYDSNANSDATVGYSATWWESGDCQFTLDCEFVQVYAYKSVTATGDSGLATLLLDVPGPGTIHFSAYVSAYAKASGTTSNASASLGATVSSFTLT